MADCLITASQILLQELFCKKPHKTVLLQNDIYSKCSPYVYMVFKKEREKYSNTPRLGENYKFPLKSIDSLKNTPLLD